MIEYVTGETMEIYSAVLFLWLITGLIFLINAICSHTWTDLVESGKREMVINSDRRLNL